MKKKKIVFIVLIIIIFTLLFFLTSIMSGKANEKKLQEQLELGRKYLSELNYEQSIVSYLVAIDIDAGNEEAYIGAAEAYIGLENYEEALMILQKGYEVTGNDSIKVYIDKIKYVSNINTMKETTEDQKIENQDIKVEDGRVIMPKSDILFDDSRYNINGKNFYEYTVKEISDQYAEKYGLDKDNYGEGEWIVSGLQLFHDDEPGGNNYFGILEASSDNPSSVHSLYLGAPPYYEEYALMDSNLERFKKANEEILGDVFGKSRKQILYESGFTEELIKKLDIDNYDMISFYEVDDNKMVINFDNPYNDYFSYIHSDYDVEYGVYAETLSINFNTKDGNLISVSYIFDKATHKLFQIQYNLC